MSSLREIRRTNWHLRPLRTLSHLEGECLSRERKLRRVCPGCTDRVYHIIFNMFSIAVSITKCIGKLKLWIYEMFRHFEILISMLHIPKSISILHVPIFQYFNTSVRFQIKHFNIDWWNISKRLDYTKSRNTRYTKVALFIKPKYIISAHNSCNWLSNKVATALALRLIKITKEIIAKENMFTKRHSRPRCRV